MMRLRRFLIDKRFRFLAIVLVSIAILIPQRSHAADASSTPTWSHDIAPILYKHCTTCHHPGGAGPFSLLTYADARRWASQIVPITQSRTMPPWLPEPAYGDFAENRRLADADIDRLRTWFKAGMAEGDPKSAPAPPAYDANWQLGKPDLVLNQSQPFTLPAGGTDVFLNFVFPYPLAQGHYIRAMEIRPGAPQVVHHANILVDRTGSFRRQHPGDWQAGIPGMEIFLDAGNTFDPDSHFLFWKPDTPALIEPEGMPWRLDPGNDLILNIHLKPSGKSETVNARIGLYFTDKPPTKQPMLLQLDRDDALDIPAGKSDFVVEDSLTLPVDVEALGVYPHAHYLGKDMQAWATLPNGEKKWLVWIRDWDIDRQSVYRYTEPLGLPKGTVIHMRYLYDNSVANPRNPHNPPIRVHAGNRSEDEMSHLWLQVLPTHVDPLSPDPRLLLEEAWMRNRLTHTPNDRISLYNLATSLSGQGKFADAVPVFNDILQLVPDDPGTLIALGAALEGAGDTTKAQETLAQAITSRQATTAQRCDAHFDLASISLRAQQIESAQHELQQELSLCPDDPEAHFQLASIYAQTDHLAQALSELRRAAELKPSDPATHSALAQLLASAGSPSEAIIEQRKALNLLDNDPDGWNNLGVLEARAGHSDEARRAFQHALQLDPAHQEAKANLARLPAPK